MGIIFRATGRDLLFFPRIQRLVFGLYAWVDAEQKRKIDDAGSGVMIAPRLGLTARHVTSSFRKLDPQFAALDRRKTIFDDQYAIKELQAEYGVLIYQVTGKAPEVTEDERNLWLPTLEWPSSDTDISLMELKHRTPVAEALQHEMQYLQWQLLPPPIGAIVKLFGFPEPRIETEGEDHTAEVDLEQLNAQVVEHVYPLQAHGYGEFPAFRLHRSFAHGFSGGAVVYNERLVGIFSGPDLVSCLWPLALMEYVPSDGVKRSIPELLQTNQINAMDWDEVRGRVERVSCDEALSGTAIETRCTKQHVILRK